VCQYKPSSFTNLIVPDTTHRTYDFFSTTHDHRSRSKETIRRCNTESKFSELCNFIIGSGRNLGGPKKISVEYKKILTRFESYSGEWRGNTLPLMTPFKLKAEDWRLIGADSMLPRCL